jgi:biopolymer transport protein ExbB
MKKIIASLIIAGMLSFGISNAVLASVKTNTDTTKKEQKDTAAAKILATEEENILNENPNENKTFHQILKEKFIEGGPGFMAIILLFLVLGLALSIERILYLNLSTTNTKKLLSDVESTIEKQGIDSAKEICRNTRGPVASIFYQGLNRHNEGLEIVEKSIISYGSVLTGRLEKGLSWISLFISIAPMLGFMGTVIGMIGAFDNIETMGNISPAIVAGGIKVALLTTVFGLIVAVILQIFYNYIISKIDGIINAMENSAISFMDILTKYKSLNK